MKKKIYVLGRGGFGNKAFDLISCVYYKKIYPESQVIYVEYYSYHNIKNDPLLEDIFPKTKEIINFELPKNYEKFEGNTIHHIYPVDFKNLNEFPEYKKLNEINRFHSCYNLIEKIWNYFNNYDKSFFEINNNLLDKNIINYKTKKYAIIHIRYGDKINIAIKNFNKSNNEKFPIYTPEYYIKIINKLNKKDVPIILITDSKIIVEKFILNKISNKKNIKILDVHWLNAFYLLCYGTYVIMSYSTFSFLAGYFNKNKKSKYYLLNKYSKTKDNYIPEDDALSQTWKIFNNKKYLLNYDFNYLLKIKKTLKGF
jgi:hypothetical protein